MSNVLFDACELWLLQICAKRPVVQSGKTTQQVGAAELAERIDAGTSSNKPCGFRATSAQEEDWRRAQEEDWRRALQTEMQAVDGGLAGLVNAEMNSGVRQEARVSKQATLLQTQMNGSEQTKNNMKTALVRTQMNSCVAEETQNHMRASLVRTQMESADGMDQGCIVEPQQSTTLMKIPHESICERSSGSNG